MRVFTVCPRPFFPIGMEEGVAFSRDMFLQARAFQERGHESSVVLLHGPDVQEHPEIIRATLENMSDIRWWEPFHLDVAVLGAWAEPQYTPIARAIQGAGIRLVVRCDSSGKYSQFGRPVREVIRDNFWSLQQRINNPVLRSVPTAVKTVLNYSPYHARERKQLEHFSCADLICIESPGAADSLRGMLVRHGREDIAKRVRHISHPVEIAAQRVCTAGRSDQILCVGRWEAYPKNTPLLVRSIVDVLRSDHRYHAVIAGRGDEVIRRQLDRVRCPKTIRERIHILGAVPHSEILELCTKSKIYFVASRWESFNIAAAESLCLGCSVVGPRHISSMRNFVSKNSGTTAAGYAKKALLAALRNEIGMWDNGSRDSAAISEAWQKEVSALAVADTMIRELFAEEQRR